jgi:hypothetical protein
MTSKTYHNTQKHVHFKTYQHLWQLEKELGRITSKKNIHLQISVLGKVSQDKEDIAINKSKEANTIRAYWKTHLVNSVKFGSFYNPEIGIVFIVGALASIFLHKVSGKPLAMMSAGPYGIFRGLGVSEAHTSLYLKMLNSGRYLLIIRGNENEIELL